MAKAKTKASNVPSSSPPQFRPAGQAMLVSRQMSRLPQARQHLPHSGQALHMSQAAPMAYQPARPESSVPLLLQQRSVFPGGYLPTTGAPMPPPSYIYGPSSVPPPVVQPPDRSLDQSLPPVTSQIQSWHQPASSPATLPSVNSDEPSSSDWQVHTCTDGKRYYHNKKTGQSSWGKPVELMTPLEVTQFTNAKAKSAESSSLDWQENTSTDGRKYYYNKKTRQSSWEKPAELMTPLEVTHARADASTEWIGFSTSEGRKYYYNRVTKESTWTIPDRLKIAREFAEKVSSQLRDWETETTVGAAVCAEPSSVLANQSPSIVGVVSSRTRNAAANSVPPEASLSYHVDNNSSFSDFGIQNDVPSIPTVAPPIRSTEVPSVESDSRTSRTNNENSFLTSHSDTQDGASAEDLQDAEKTMPVTGKVHPISLEEKTSEEEILVYSNKLDARNAFRALLESVGSDWTWRRALRVIINDKRYGALGTLEDSLQAFNEYFNQLEKLKPDERCVKQKACAYFVTMLEECNKLTAKTRLREALTILQDDERFNAIEHLKEREALVENYLAELQNKERAKASEKHKDHIADYRVLLESCDFIKASTRWRKVQDRLEDDERCSRLEVVDRLDIFEEYIQDLEKKEEEQKRLQQQARRQERKKRDDFRKLLEEHVANGTLTAKTRWRLYCEQVKSSPTYLGVASNTTGSTPKDLFEDVMEDLEEQYEADKSQIKEAIESCKLPMMASWTFEDFQTAVMAIGSFKGISDINMKLIYAKLIVRLREKEVNEAKKRERLGDRFSGLLYSIMEISTSSTWDNSKPLFEGSQEYRNLNNETYARDLFEKHVFHLKERLKEKERLREEEKAKKEREHEEKEKKREFEEKERKKETMKEKEKERKEKERKEREREKERERDKGKDCSRRDGVHFDGAGANTHGSKDKKSDKDKDNKHKRCHHDTGDDVMSERDDSSHSQRHSSDRKKSRKDIMLQTPIVKIGVKTCKV